jgi:hypothetical protein
MESKLRKQRWGWEYISKNGNTYSIGPVTAEFNVVVDDFEDINKLFDGEAIVHNHLVDYVYGEIEEDPDDIKSWLDWRIDKYEKHERTVKFYTNHIKRSDVDVLYECYIGVEEKKRSETRKIERNRMMRIAEEIRGGR